MNKLIFLIFSAIFSQIPNGYVLENINDYYLLRDNRNLTDDLLSKSIVDLRVIDNSSIAVGTSGGIGLIGQGINFYSYNL